MVFGAIYFLMAQYLTYDEKKAAEAAFRGLPCDPTWSEAARDVYAGLVKALHVHAPADQQDEMADLPAEETMADRAGSGQERRSDPIASDIAESQPEAAPDIQNPILNRDEAIEAGILIDVTPLAQELGLNLPVGISKPLWEIGITASNKLHDEQYNERVRDVLMALRLHLETNEVSSPWIKFPALLSFPPQATPQVCSLYAVAHKDPSAPYSLTLLLPHEMSAIKPTE
ncbi:MAG TPA: hypothetical protein VJ692_08235 [Nitrospiraceae bacterium]|nr:hypothetical protein [Nitrospiraceae bacterium]